VRNAPDEGSKPTERSVRSSTGGPVEVAAAVGLVFLPVTVLLNSDPSLTLVFPWSLINVTPRDPVQTLHVFSIVEYLGTATMSYGGLPASLRAWPVALALHMLAVVSAGMGWAFGREDRRVTAGLLTLAGGASLWVAIGLGNRIGATVGADPVVTPVGAVTTWVIVVILYR
jgi:hypothetical protein